MLQGVWPEILPVGPSQNESQHLLYSLPAKVHIVKAMGFPVVMNGFEKWTIKRDHQRIDASVLWCWRRLLKSPLDCKDLFFYLIAVTIYLGNKYIITCF